MMKAPKPAAKTAWSLTTFVSVGALPALRAVICALFLLVPGVVFAQESSGDETRSAASADEAAADDDTARPLEKTEKDDPELLLKGKRLERYLEWLKSQESPDYSITSVQLEGSANGDKTATLKATIAIQINRDGRDVLVPLDLNEATLTGHTYRGSGTATPDDDFNREKGYHWWLRGQGQHVLELSMIVPIKQQLPSRRLQLTIPRTAVSGLELQVPLERISTKVTPKDAWVKVTSVPKAGSVVETKWSGRRLDLSWEPILQQGPVETVLQSRTVIDVKLTDEWVFVEATQQIQALKGSFSKVDVTLPAGFQFLNVDGKDYEDHQIGAGSHVTVTLLEPVKGPTELKWSLQTPFPGSGGKLTLDGFEVDGARRQNGEIAIHGLDGYRMTRREEDDRRHVYRMSVAELTNSEQATTAYRFRKQPFRLELDLQEIAPGFTVKPRVWLRMQEDRIQLEGSFEFQVYRGAVREFQLVWPQAGAQGWKIETVGPAELLNRDQVTTDLQETPLRMPLLGRRTGTFQVELKASRPIIAGENFTLSLPSVASSSSEATLLEVFTEENAGVELTLDGAEGGRLPQQNSGPSELLPEDLRELVRTTYRIDEREVKLNSKLNIHEREISTGTTAQISLNDKQLLVSQRITYNVAFERLSQVLLLVPKELGQRVQFLMENDVELSAAITPLDEGTYYEVRLALPESQIGEFEITVKFAVDLETLPLRGDHEEISVPLVQSADSEIGVTRLEWDQGGRFDIAPLDEQEWTAHSSVGNSQHWVADGSRRNIGLRIGESIRKRAQDLYVRKALLRTIVEANGVSRSWAQYRIDSETSGVAITLPPDKIVLDGAWWQGRRLNASEIIAVDESRGEFRFEDSSPIRNDNRLLTLEYHSQGAPPLSWNRDHQLAAPKFASGVWVEESIWRVSLPGNQLLFTEPSNYTPRYRWQRRGLLWSRQTAASSPEMNDWIGAEDGPALPLGNATGSSYRFSRFGPPASLTFRAMSLPFVVLFGAGLSLAVGFILLYLPLTRNVLAFLFIAFAVSIMSLWFPAPVEVLLQPAVLGLLLAIAAALINSVVRREKQVPVLTMSSPSEFGARLSGLSSVETVPSRGPGSEEPTTLRPAANSANEVVAAPESGSHL